MLIIGTIILATLSFFNSRIGRSWLYPPALFSGIWAVLLGGLWLSGDKFEPISIYSISIFVVGTLAFSVGGLPTISDMPSLPQKSQTEEQRQNIYKALNIAILVLALAFPLYIQKLIELSLSYQSDNFFIGLRGTTSNESGSLGIFSYIIAFSTFFALVGFCQDDGHRKRRAQSIILIIIAFIYSLSTTARIGALMLGFSLVGIACIRNAKINIKALLIGSIGTVSIFSLGAVVLNKGASIETSLGENISSISDGIQAYALSGIVAFDQVINGYSGVTSDFRSLRFFGAFAKAIGFDVNLPSSNLDYTLVPIPTNIYTIYFGYFTDFGWIGLIALMFLLGLITSWIFKRAVNKDPFSMIMYSLIFSSLILTCASDPFLISLSYWIQATIFLKAVFLFTRERKKFSNEEVGNEAHC